MTKKLIVASLLLSAAAAFCAAQVRVEFRKTGDTLTLYGNGQPMQRQRKQTQKMLAGLQNGNTVATSGGIIGTIVAIEDDTLVLRVKPDNVKIQVARSSVSSMISGEGKK